MRASLRYVVRNLGRRRLRTGAGVVGIFLTLAFLTAIQIGLDSVSTSYTELVSVQAGKADVVVGVRGGTVFQPKAFDPVVAAGVLQQRAEVKGATPRLTGIVRVAVSGQPQFALLLGVDSARERELGLWGLSPEPALVGPVCVISRALAKRMSVEAGGRVELVGDSGVGMWLEVESVVKRQRLVPQEVPAYVVVNEAVARALLGEGEGVHSLAARMRVPGGYYDSRDLQGSLHRLRAVGEEVALALGRDYDVRLPKAAALMAFHDVASPVRAAFGVFVFLALCVTGLLVYSIVSVGVEERVREFAILRTLGARRGHVFRLVLFESAVLCGLGVVPGVLAGGAVARVVLWLVEWVMGGGTGTVSLTWSVGSARTMLVAGMFLAVGSALVPAWQATRWAIVDALDPLRRGRIRATDLEVSSAQRAWFLTGLALSAVSVVVFFVLPAAFLSGDSALIGTVVLGLLLAIFLGFTMVAVSGLPVLEIPMMKVLGLCVGPAAALGSRNLRRHRRRNRTTSLMFVLSVALVVFVASLVVLLSRMTMTMVQHFNGADLRLQSENSLAGGLADALAAVDGVERVSTVRYLRSRSVQGMAYDVVMSDLVGLKHLWLVPFGVDGALPQVMFTNHVRYAEGGWKGLVQVANHASRAQDTGTMVDSVPPLVLSLAAARFLDVGVGESVELAFHMGAERRVGRFQVVAICSALPGFEEFRSRVAHAVGSGVLLPMSSFLELTEGVPREAQLVRYLVDVDEGSGVEGAVARTIRDRYDLRFGMGVKSVKEQQEGATVAYWTTQVFFGLLLVVAVTVAVFALIASMASSVMERRWEVGMLKALGLRHGQLFRMFLSEALGITLSAGLAGGAIGFLLAWLFVMQAGALGEVPVVFALPYVTFAATIIVSVLAGAAAAHLPTRRLLKQSAAEILRME